MKLLLVAAFLILGTGLSAEALEDTTSHYTTPENAPQLADPDEHSNFSDGQAGTEYPGNRTRSQYYMGNDDSSPSTYSTNHVGPLQYGFSGGTGATGSTTYGPNSHY